jgi:alkylation response protein AidB-like acyl-CoA dehydrogenase
MHIAFTPEQVALRDEIAAYFGKLITPELREALRPHVATPLYREVVEQMGKDGMLALGWPTEYGGRGFGPVEQLIFVREALRAGAALPFLTLSTVGPTLMHYGSEEQKARFLPAIAQGKIHFSIGYTEPESGTDLASLKTRAVRDGDHFIVNGSKIYTSLVEGADYVWLAVRTDPDARKHEGISLLIVDVNTPGFSFTPMETVAGMRTNVTYYSDVKVPANMLVGGLNKGWELITSQLNFERIGIAARCIHGEELYRRVYDWARETEHRGMPVAEQPMVRHLLANVYARLELVWLLNFRMAWKLSQGTPDPGFASAAKVHGVESMIEVCRDLLQIVGSAGLIRRGSATAALNGDLEAEYRKCQNSTFGGGSAEVMREIVAQRGLAMPKVVR